MLDGTFPRIPPCQEEGEFRCSSCGDLACCREHAEAGCGYDTPYYWPAPIANIWALGLGGPQVDEEIESVVEEPAEIPVVVREWQGDDIKEGTQLRFF